MDDIFFFLNEQDAADEVWCTRFPGEDHQDLLPNVSLSLFKPNPSQLATNLLVMLSKQVTKFQDLFIFCFWMFTYHLLRANQLFIDLSWANTDSKEYFTEQANEFSASVLLHRETLFIVHEFILEQRKTLRKEFHWKNPVQIKFS